MPDWTPYHPVGTGVGVGTVVKIYFITFFFSCIIYDIIPRNTKGEAKANIVIFVGNILC